MTQMLNVRFAREKVKDLVEGTEFLALLVAHKREVGHFQDIELAPNWDAYFQSDDVGGLRVYTVRGECVDPDYQCSLKHLMGYCIFFTHQDMHSRESFQAVQDSLFLAKEHRGARHGYNLIKWCDEQLRADGVQVVYHSTPAADSFGSMLRRLGYEPVEHVWARRLDK